MTKNLLKSLFILITLSFALLQSCEKHEIISDTEQEYQVETQIKPVNLSEIEIENGILIFDSMEEYQGVLANTEITYEEIKAWEKEIGFISIQTILENALEEEEKYFEQFDPETLTEEDIERIVKEKEALGYTEYTQKYIDAGILKPYITDEISSLELAVVSSINERFLNTDGIVKVGDIVYQFTHTQCKKILDGDMNKIDLLKNVSEDVQNKNIIVGNLVKYKDIHERFAHVPKVSGNYRIEAEIWLRRWDYTYDKDYYYYTAYRNYKRNMWGKFKQDPTADTYHYISANSTWRGGSQPGYVNIVKNNLWAHNQSVIFLDNIPNSTNVTFSVNYSWFKRNKVDGIANCLHDSKTR